MLEVGNLVFVTGGLSVGKSKIMRSIVNSIVVAQSTSARQADSQPRVSMVMVNGRMESDLVSVLTDVARSEPLEPSMRKAASRVLSGANLTYNSHSGDAYGFDTRAANFAKMSVAQAVTALAVEHPRNTNYTVLILDDTSTVPETPRRPHAPRSCTRPWCA